MRNNVLETLIGTVVLVLSVAFVLYGYRVSDVAPKHGYVLNAAFDRIDGLSIGSDVRLSGIKIGTVLAQEINPETFEAKVQIAIQSDIMLPEDTGAKITMEGLLGGTYISLTPGGSEEFLTDGDDLIYTQGAVDFINLVSQALFTAKEDDATQ